MAAAPAAPAQLDDEARLLYQDVLTLSGGWCPGGASRMIDLYTWTTPNGRKASIMLEECGLPYEVHAIDIGKDEQFQPSFLVVSPNNKIPAIVDRSSGHSVFESGAVLLYLARKAGRFWPRTADTRIATLEWLMWQVGGLGPMLGQLHYFGHFNPGKAPAAEERFRTEAHRLYGVLEQRLSKVPYLAGPEITVADFAAWPWISRFEWHDVDWSKLPSVKRWYVELASRPGLRRGFDVPATGATIPMPG